MKQHDRNILKYFAKFRSEFEPAYRASAGVKIRIVEV
jgi:hypothetical protein